MGTSWSARLVAPSDRLPAIDETIRTILDGVIAEMSNWERDSAISRFNRAPGGSWHALPSAFFHVLQNGLAVARSSGGAFDPTIGALVDLWGFGPAPAPVSPPAAAEIDAAAALGGWRRIEIDPPARRARQPGGLRIDLSGIAKGHAVDAVAEALGALGLRHFLIEIGGELRGAGIRPDGQPWWVDIETPPDAALRPARVALHGLSIATSGDYRRYRDVDGERLAHSIDPRTGRPIANGLASVTLLHPSCMMADAYATALTILGAEQGHAYALSEGLAALFVTRTRDGFVERLTPALEAMLD